VTHRIHSLVIALRVAYGASIGTFVLAVAVVIGSARTTVTDEPGGGFDISFDVPDGSPAILVIDWMALLAFAFAAAGALLTVLARVSSPTYSVDEH
jgi:hypothetical protein